MEFDGIIDSINQGDGFTNISVKLEDDKVINIKITPIQLENLMVDKAYHFTANYKEYKEKEQLVLEESISVFGYYRGIELAKCLMKFYKSAPFDVSDAKALIEGSINEIGNNIIKTIVSEIYEENKEKFWIYPAATKFHHAYIGGLMYHTSVMVKIAKELLQIYTYLNSDLTIAGIILHDISKVKEFTASINPSYSLEGQLIGHIVLSVMEIEKIALKHGFVDEEVLLLKHIVLSHHGQFEYGSPRKPMIAEAELVYLIDNMDSKMTVLGETLGDTASNEFTLQVPVIERQRFYKHDIDIKKP